MKTTKTTRKLILPVIIVAITVILMMLIFNNPPSNNRVSASKAPQMTVKTSIITPQKYQVMVQSFGTVKPRTQSNLYAQVSGQIKSINTQFRAGGFFETGDVLVQLDDRDHRAEVKIAQASLMQAKQNLQEEGARVRQAEADWQRLGNGKKASALVLRQPQFATAQAQVLSAEAQLDKAKLSLERTKIIAPYAGRILNKSVDIGQFVSSNTLLAEIYAVDYVEIRLPIKNKDLPLMVLPEEYRNADNNVKATKATNTNSQVILSSDLMGDHTWQGQIVRTESAIDKKSQQLYVVAQILRPYDHNFNQGAQIKMGQYVTAQITGKTLDKALIIPSSAVYQGSYVYIVENGLLMRKGVQLSWQNGAESIVSSGLKANDELVLTSLGQVSSGTPVAIEGKKAAHKKHRSNKLAAKVAQ